MNKAQIRIKKEKKLLYLKMKMGKTKLQITKLKNNLKITDKEIKNLIKELK